MISMNIRLKTLLDMGKTLNEKGQWEDALECYDKALEIGSSCADTWCNRGLTLYLLERFEEALPSFEKALKINPENETALTYYGLTLLELNRDEEIPESFIADLAEQQRELEEEWYLSEGAV
jgi:tetratricopeptide (TPR) repeat protein